MKEFSVVGKPISRVDGAEKVSGKALYTADRRMPEMVWGRVLRSPVPHARITSIDVSKAKKLPGVLAVITARDLSTYLFGRQLKDMPVLANDRVRFVGEKVVAIAALTPEIAEQAASLVEITYAELSAVFSALAAISEGAPILHEHLASYSNAPKPLPRLPNVHSHVRWARGDCERGFKESDFTVEQTFTTHRSHQAYIEPHACIVSPGPQGRISVWASNKVPFQSRQYLSEVLGIDAEQILFHLSPVGGDFGGKGSLMDIPIAYQLAKAAGRPVKMVMTYNEELMAGNPRHPSHITIKTGVSRDGKLLARKVQVVFDSGAYAAFKPNATINLPGARHAAGAYFIPNVSVEALSVYTNNVPSGHMRGPGDPQVYFAVESHTDFIARKLEMDPLELRRINVLGRGAALPSGHDVDTDCGKTLLENIRKKIQPARRKRAYNFRGKGMALALRDIGPGEANVAVGLKSGGRVYLLTTVTDTGAGAHTTLAQIVAETLGIPPQKVDILLGTTDSFSTDIALGGSRVNYMAGRAALVAALKLKQRARQIVAQKWGCTAEAISMENGILFGPGRKISFSDLTTELAEAGTKLEEAGHFATSERAGTLSFFAQVAEVEVEAETGRLTILKITSVNDVGTIINPLVHQAQIDGGVVQGVGYAAMEHLQDADGRIVTANFGDYKIPSIVDIPQLETMNIHDSTGPGPFASKPIGENTVTPTAAAIANAVYDATGIQITDLPITSEKIFFALKHGGK